MKTLLAIFALAILAGCAGTFGFEAADGMGINVTKMQAAQIKATAELVKSNREKDSTARCVRIPSPWGVGSVVELNVDTAGKMQGRATIAPDCTVTIESDSRPAAVTK